MDESNEMMYIARFESHKLIKATLDGNLISSIGSRGSDPSQFDGPMGLCQDASGDVYVADQNNHRVQILRPDLVFKKQIKCCGVARGVTIDSLGTLHVVTSLGLERFPAKSDIHHVTGGYWDVWSI